jgi:hypothetical protein
MAYTKTSDVAKLIRMELKQAFPGVKFSVKTRRSSAVDIDYVDGPTFSDVSEVLDKYERGTFDGMQDMYIHDKNKKGPTVDYVFVKRDYSDEKIKRCETSKHNYMTHGNLDCFTKKAIDKLDYSDIE